MSEELSVDDAISILWVNAPDAMEVVLRDLADAREGKIHDIRAAKQRGVSHEWILGEMITYKDISDFLSKPDTLSDRPL
jgi:hypothetical protein